MKKVEYENKLYTTRKFLTRKIIGSIIRDNILGGLYLTFDPEDKIFRIDTSGIIVHKFPQYQEVMSDMETCIADQIEILQEKIRKVRD